ncbi:MAG TPA: electron transfer flavoprotein beta subunit/FixA family protein [Deltaproteobacteria bacterium]|nr:electron transfer flavoprotein beta subunit/FixA family protein [Deltaproteobacteria bacterium]
MNIIVAMKQVPDLHHIRIRNREPVLDDIPMVLGDIDKSALAAAVELKETTQGRVIIMSAGNRKIRDTVKEALAAGGDEAILIEDDDLADEDSSVIAGVLAAAIQRIGDVGIVVFGEGSADNYSGRVFSAVAAILGYPQVGYAKRIELNDSLARVTRSLEDSDEIIEVPLPAVISVVSEIKEPRIPSVKNILKARKKPTAVYHLNELCVEVPAEKNITTISNLAPVSRRKGIVITSVDELAKILKNDRKPDRQAQ